MSSPTKPLPHESHSATQHHKPFEAEFDSIESVRKTQGISKDLNNTLRYAIYSKWKKSPLKYNSNEFKFG